MMRVPFSLCELFFFLLAMIPPHYSRDTQDYDGQDEGENDGKHLIDSLNGIYQFLSHHYSDFLNDSNSDLYGY